MRNLLLGQVSVLIAAVLTAASLAAPAAAEEPETVLYSFCAHVVGKNCTDGADPEAGLIMDAAGQLYGTTYSGGAHPGNPGADGMGGGAVFALTPNAAKTKWTETVLYSFCPHVVAENCPDGEGPSAGLIMDKAGHLYGTTFVGGAHLRVFGGGGTVFALTPNAAKTEWTETVLYSFCAQGGDKCTDGAGPMAGLIMDASGHLYGTTSLDGANHPDGIHAGGGTVFALTANAAKTKWTETVLYSFCAQGGDKCTDGAGPMAGLIMDASGHLYGTTAFGGAHARGLFRIFIWGTVFELTPNAAKTTWTETVLYSFCAQGGTNCTDGPAPRPA